MRRSPLALAACVAICLAAGCTNTPVVPIPLPAPESVATPGPDFATWQAGKSTPVADPIYPGKGNAGIDVLHYGLDLAWEPTTKVFTGTATLRVHATQDLAKLELDFSHSYTIDAVTVDGATVNSEVAKDKLTVPSALPKERDVTVVVRYHGTPTTVPMPSHRGDSEGLGLTVTADGSLWTMQEPYGAFTWYPVNDQPSDKALYDISITVPDGWAGIAGGTPVAQNGNTFKYTTTDPVASYLTTLAVGKYAKETATGPHGLPLTYWYRPGVDDDKLAVMRKSPQLIEWLEERFGPYPFPSAGAVIVDSESAMETQQLITMGDFDATPAEYENVLLHEYAHHWFGNTVGPSKWNDVWLNEGWATYVEALYANPRRNVTDKAWETWARGRDAKLRADVGPPGNPKPDSFAESNVYICPALMLHQIRKQIGDQAFFALGRAWVGENRNSARDRAAFIALVNKQTGKDFSGLINTWLDSSTTPK